MRKLALLGIAAGILCGTGTLTTPANAAATAYLSRTGGGALCTLAAPCNSMSTAIGVAGAGGEVICLDKSNYGDSGSNIIFSITISCGDGLWEAPFSGIVISTPAGADVAIEGLVSDSLANTGAVVIMNGQGSLHLRRVRIGNNTSNNGPAISFMPSGTAKLFVMDSVIYNFGASGVSSAILVKPASGVTANVIIERTSIENSQFGIVADGGNGGIIRGVVRNSTIAGNVNNGITVSTTSSSVVLSVDGCTISGNNFGLVAGGSNAGLLVGRSVISGNNTGLFTSSAGALLSYRDNRLNGNTSDGAFTGSVGLQ